MSKPSPDRPRILRLRADGWTYAEIGADVGLSPGRIGAIIRQHQKRTIIAEMRARDVAHDAAEPREG